MFSMCVKDEKKGIKLHLCLPSCPGPDNQTRTLKTPCKTLFVIALPFSADMDKVELIKWKKPQSQSQIQTRLFLKSRIS